MSVRRQRDLLLKIVLSLALPCALYLIVVVGLLLLDEYVDGFDLPGEAKAILLPGFLAVGLLVIFGAVAVRCLVRYDVSNRVDHETPEEQVTRRHFPTWRTCFYLQ
jgi:hypothetical protein